ncbi:eEF2 [Symbiodinium microadriaticum]|nr:eEF2 [Symbiodinium microadriaticum]
MHHSLDPNPKNLPKQRNLWSLAASLPLEDSVAVEIGFNAGHSALLMLSAHPKLQVIAFDLCEHAYTKPCFDILAAAFPGRLRLVPGKSQQTLPKWTAENSERADLVHIDGDHDPAAARTDLRNAKTAARSGAWVVFDDTCFSPLKAVWTEMLESQLITLPARQFCLTSRHGIARYSQQACKQEDLLSGLRPALEHRGRLRHILVMAPTDHGQDSLLGYLSRHRSCTGKAVSKKLLPNTKERHQSQWISLPLRYDPPDDLPCLLHLVAPHFGDTQQITDCFPLVDGLLVVVDCAEGLTDNFCTTFGSAVAHGLQPVLFLNKLDKLLALEPDNELCYQRLCLIVDRLNGVMDGVPSLKPLTVEDGSIVFGRGSLSVAESIGGWGFTLEQFLTEMASRKDWSPEQVEKLRPRLWGDHFYNGRWRDSDGERGFCKLVLQQIRGIYATLEAPDNVGLARLQELGVTPKEGLTGNAWKQSAMEAWMPLADVLLGALTQHVPAPQAPPSNAVFYASRCVESTDGQCFAFGRQVLELATPPFETYPDSAREALPIPVIFEHYTVSVRIRAYAMYAEGSDLLLLLFEEAQREREAMFSPFEVLETSRNHCHHSLIVFGWVPGLHSGKLRQLQRQVAGMV